MRGRTGAALAVAAMLVLQMPAGAAAPHVRVRPAHRDVTARVGGTVTVPFVADGPAAPAKPLDVLFLVDTTPWPDAAMFTATRDALGLAAHRLAARKGARIGVATFADLGDVDTAGEQQTYRMLRQPAAADAALYDTIASLRTTVADHPLGAAVTIGLDQMLHGDGHLTVPAGLAARFRPDAHAVVVIVSASAIAQDPMAVLYPSTYDIGWEFGRIDRIAVLPTAAAGDNDLPDEYEDVLDYSRRAFRRAACGDDVDTDVQPNGYVVCAPWFDAERPSALRDALGAQIPGLVDALGARVYTAVRTPEGMPTEKDENGWTTRWNAVMRGTTDSLVDPTRAWRLSPSVELYCPKGTAGKTYTFTFVATRDYESLPADGSIRLHCR